MKIILKISGKNIDPKKDHFITSIAELWRGETKFALVHGGGPQISRFMEKMGKNPAFVNGLRITDRNDMDLIEMVLSGLLNKTLVGMFHRNGIDACGISGRDSRLLLAEKHSVVQADESFDIGRVGEIVQVNPKLIEVLWDNNILPVVSPVSIDKQDGSSLNVNADWAAAQLAIHLHAEKLFLFTDVPGVLADPAVPSSLIEMLPVGDIPLLIQRGIVSGGMIPKLQMIQKVLREGVGEVFIAGGNSLENLDQLFRGQSVVGTKIIP